MPQPQEGCDALLGVVTPFRGAVADSLAGLGDRLVGEGGNGLVVHGQDSVLAVYEVNGGPDCCLVYHEVDVVVHPSELVG